MYCFLGRNLRMDGQYRPRFIALKPRPATGEWIDGDYKVAPTWQDPRHRSRVDEIDRRFDALTFEKVYGKTRKETIDAYRQEEEEAEARAEAMKKRRTEEQTPEPTVPVANNTPTQLWPTQPWPTGNL